VVLCDWRAYYQALYRTAMALGESQLDVDAVLRQLLRGVVDALKLKAASIRLISGSEGLLESVATEGLSSDYLRKGAVDVAHSAADREALGGQTVVVDDVSTDPRFEYPAEATCEGIVSAVFVPLVVQGEPIGVLRAYSGETRSFTADEMELLLALAKLGALSISNSRLYQLCTSEHQMTVDMLRSFHLTDDWQGMR
jgi:GAF domain-containing protein